MIIPKEFSLFGEKIKVEFKDSLDWETDSVGEARYRESRIVLQKRVKGHPTNRQRQERWFCHELVHHILFQLKEEAYSNEKFVENVGALIHQFLTTQQGKQ